MEQKKIRVAQIIGKAGEGGVEKMIVNLYQHIDRARVIFDFYVENTSLIVDKQVIEQCGGRVFIIPPYKHLRRFMRCLERHFKENHYDIVHANMNALNVFPLKVAKKCGIPIRISHSHTMSSKKEKVRHLVKSMLRPFSKRYATHLIACSDFAGAWLFGQKAMRENNVQIIENAIELETFRFQEKLRHEIRAELGISDSTKVLGHIGRFCHQKNHLFLLEILKHLQNANEDTALLLVGTGETMEKCRAFVRENALKNVFFIGAVPDAFRYYNAMDCFVLPSLYEGLPVVGVEAQANGLKCFFSAGVTHEAKLLDQTEFLPLDIGPEGWANKIGAFLNQDKLRVEGTIDPRFDIENSAAKLLSLYECFVNQ